MFNTTKKPDTMTIVKYRPTRAMVTPFNDLVNEFFGRDIAHLFGSDDLPVRAPRVNIIERKDDFKLDLLAPGFSKTDIQLNVEDNTLTVSAEKKVEHLQENERYTRREFGTSAFRRSFQLPEHVKTDAIKAEFNNGILSVILPKAAESKPKSRTISID